MTIKDFTSRLPNDIGGFDKSGWLISSYLLGYVSTYTVADLFMPPMLMLPRCGGCFRETERHLWSQASHRDGHRRVHGCFCSMWGCTDNNSAVSAMHRRHTLESIAAKLTIA